MITNREHKFIQLESFEDNEKLTLDLKIQWILLEVEEEWRGVHGRQFLELEGQGKARSQPRILTIQTQLATFLPGGEIHNYLKS